MNPADKSTDKLLCENQGGGWEIADWSPDDKTLLVVNGISVNESHLFTVDVASGQKTPLTPVDEKLVAYSPIGFSADGKGVYVTTDKDNEFQRLAYVDLATKQFKYLTNYPWDVEDTALSWNRKLLAYTVNENGMSTLHVLNVATGKELPVPKLPIGVIGGLKWHENNDDLAFVITSARSPFDSYSITVSTRKVDR
jgi:Tol biopolymer transport system component